jgi:methylmalonyl-CoA mutase
VPLVDVPMYVMTPEFGAASQLEKIDMLDFAEFVAINKFDRKGAADALRDVAKQVQRNREAFGSAAEQMPVFGTMASRFNDDGVTALYQALQAAPGRAGPEAGRGSPAARWPRATARTRPHRAAGARVRYLADIADTVRGYKRRAPSRPPGARGAAAARERARMLHEDEPDARRRRRTPC